MGSLPALALSDPDPQNYPYRAMHGASQKYAKGHGAMTIGLGSDFWVILNGIDEIKKFSMSDHGVDRPDLGSLLDLYAYGKPLGEKK